MKVVYASCDLGFTFQEEVVEFSIVIGNVKV